MKCPHMVIEIFEAEIFREDSLDDVQLYNKEMIKVPIKKCQTYNS